MRKDEKSANVTSRETVKFVLRFQCKLLSFHSSKYKVEFGVKKKSQQRNLISLKAGTWHQQCSETSARILSPNPPS